MHIFYFSGTGNSYYVAKKIGEVENQVKITSISSLSNVKKLESNDKSIVIIAPLYFYGIPNIVTTFLENIEFTNLEYLSVIFTAEYPNGLAMTMLKKICTHKKIKLNSCFYIKMPTNYLIKSRMLSNLEIEDTLKKADKKINKIIDIIKNRKKHYDKDSFLYSLITNATTYQKNWTTDFLEFDKYFTVNDSCTACKLCANNCPIGNIKIDKKPIWMGKCQACLKCINICPMQAIQYGNNTEGKKRYFNPEIRLNEIM